MVSSVRIKALRWSDPETLASDFSIEIDARGECQPRNESVLKQEQ
jgi:hypothetical protein